MVGLGPRRVMYIINIYIYILGPTSTQINKQARCFSATATQRGVTGPTSNKLELRNKKIPYQD